MGEGVGGAPPPPQPAGKGASASTARAIPVHAVVGSDRLTVCFFITTTKKLWPDTIINAEGAWFVPKVGVVAKISCMRTYSVRQ